MTNIRVIGGDILVVGGAICTNDNCCCPTTICTLDTSNDLDVYFDNNITNCYGTPDNWELWLRDKTFLLTWTGTEWAYTDANMKVAVDCTPTNVLNVYTVATHGFGFVADEPAAELPQDINNENVCGINARAYNGTATVSVHV